MNTIITIQAIEFTKKGHQLVKDVKGVKWSVNKKDIADLDLHEGRTYDIRYTNSDWENPDTGKTQTYHWINLAAPKESRDPVPVLNGNGKTTAAPRHEDPIKQHQISMAVAMNNSCTMALAYATILGQSAAKTEARQLIQDYQVMKYHEFLDELEGKAAPTENEAIDEQEEVPF